MPCPKEFLIRKQYLANYGGADRTNDEHYSVPVSDYLVVYATLLGRVSTSEELRGLLQSDFIYPEEQERQVKITHDSFPKERYTLIPIYQPHRLGMDPYPTTQFYFVENPRYGRGQRDTLTYATYNVAPVVEELVVNHPADFRTLLTAAPEASKKELLNLSHLDLSNAHLADLDFSQINFTGSDLRRTVGLTQELLDSSETYEQAKLPQGMIAFWSNEKKKNVLAGVEQLAAYGDKLRLSSFESGRSKGQLIVALAADLTQKINAATKYNGTFQKDFLLTLHKHDDQLNDKRFYGLKMIIANITLCVLGLGIGYIAAGVIHQRATGRFLFFNQTSSGQHVEDIQKTISPAMAG